MDKAGVSHWERTWQFKPIPKTVDPDDPQTTPVQKRLHEFYRRNFDRLRLRNGALIEVGCGNSRWLGYFAREFGCRVTGLDYSEAGCASARRILADCHVDGAVIHGDLFDPPLHLVQSFDVVVSNGLVEHFDETTHAVGALCRFLRPGGVIITSIPNMRGLPGFLQRHLDRSLYDIHVPLSREMLIDAHSAAGLEVIECCYYPFIHLGVLQISSQKGTFAKTWFRATQFGINRLGWIFERKSPVVPNSKWVSPYVFCVARKPV